MHKIQVEVRLRSGKSAAVEVGLEDKVGRLKHQAQTALGVGAKPCPLSCPPRRGSSWIRMSTSATETLRILISAMRTASCSTLSGWNSHCYIIRRPSGWMYADQVFQFAGWRLADPVCRPRAGMWYTTCFCKSKAIGLDLMHVLQLSLHSTTVTKHHPRSPLIHHQGWQPSVATVR